MSLNPGKFQLPLVQIRGALHNGPERTSIRIRLQGQRHLRPRTDSSNARPERQLSAPIPVVRPTRTSRPKADVRSRGALLECAHPKRPEVANALEARVEQGLN